MTERGIVGRGFRVAAQAGDQIWLEFDDPTTVVDGLREFLRSWEAAWVKPKGQLFRIWVGQRDFLALLWGTAEGPDACRFSDGYLLVRSTRNHPCGGLSNPGWVLLRPSFTQPGAQEIVGAIEDHRGRTPDRGGEEESGGA